MTKKILELMEKKRQIKIAQKQLENIQKYIRLKIREVKEKWMESKCNEIKELQEKGDLLALHKKVKEAAGVET